MSKSILDLFFDSVPALICVRNSYVAAVNSEASLILNRSVEGELLSDFMPPLDALRFRAAFESRSPVTAVDLKLDGFCGYRFAAAAFQRIMSRRFAVVWLFGSEAERDDFCRGLDIEEKASKNGISRFISVLTNIPTDLLDEGSRYGLLDLKAATYKFVEDITERYGITDCHADVTENEEMSALVCCPSPLPLGCFIQILSGMLLCMSDISQNRMIGVRLCSYGGERELRISADALRLSASVRSIDSLMKELPSCSPYLSLCEYAAGVCGCSLALQRSEDFESATLILYLDNDGFGAVDFKSRDQFAYYDEEFDALSAELARLAMRRKEEAQAEG